MSRKLWSPSVEEIRMKVEPRKFRYSTDEPSSKPHRHRFYMFQLRYFTMAESNSIR
jgi:hypothetical protein